MKELTLSPLFFQPQDFFLLLCNPEKSHLKSSFSTCVATKTSSNPWRDKLRTTNISTPSLQGSGRISGANIVQSHLTIPPKVLQPWLPPSVDVVSWTSFHSQPHHCAAGLPSPLNIQQRPSTSYSPLPPTV